MACDSVKMTNAFRQLVEAFSNIRKPCDRVNACHGFRLLIEVFLRRCMCKCKRLYGFGQLAEAIFEFKKQHVILEKMQAE